MLGEYIYFPENTHYFVPKNILVVYAGPFETMYDIDGNGTIDEKEMIKIIEAIYEMLGPEVTKSADDSPRKRAKMIFEKMDINNDKELTLKEFVDGCLADKELFQVGR
uniref:EF-hand domain-containing protein n=1 Tax=Meloidogyne javanica TaxID=6303 RepID=A0A915LRT9_MELJA